jgi:hypothetical protein
MQANRVFLLSPANLSGKRAKMLLNPFATFELAIRLRKSKETRLGEVFSFLSGLYFRGKWAYSQAFAKPPEDSPGVFVITTNQGLISADAPTCADELLDFSKAPIDSRNKQYSEPLIRDASRLAAAFSNRCSFVLLGSVASGKYVDLLLPIFAEKLQFPEEFVGRGDMSRGSLLLRCVAEKRMLTHVPVGQRVQRVQQAQRVERVERVQARGDAKSSSKALSPEPAESDGSAESAFKKSVIR